MQNRSPEEIFKEANEIYDSIPIEGFHDIYGEGPDLLKNAVARYKEAAMKGHLESMYRFSKLTINNSTVFGSGFYGVDLKEATGLLQKAAELGHAMAQYDLLRYYCDGTIDGIQESKIEAIKIAKKINPKFLPDKQRQKLETYLNLLKTISSEFEKRSSPLLTNNTFKKKTEAYCGFPSGFLSVNKLKK